MMKIRKLILEITTPITNHHWDKIVDAVKAVATMHIVEERVTVADVSDK